MARTVIRGVESVLDATQKRITYLFDHYDNISLSFSGGKDSTALFHLINEEANKYEGIEQLPFRAGNKFI